MDVWVNTRVDVKAVRECPDALEWCGFGRLKGLAELSACFFAWSFWPRIEVGTPHECDRITTTQTRLGGGADADGPDSDRP